MKTRTVPMASLLTKYRPCCLADVVGQAAVVRPLRLFVKVPYPCAMLFHGETRVGKTACAWALAGELGCNLADPYYGGVSEIASGEQTADSVRKTLESLRIVCVECGGRGGCVARRQSSPPASTRTAAA